MTSNTEGVDPEVVRKTYLLFAVGRMLDRCVLVDGGCVEWTGCMNSRGYGVVSFRGKRVLTHRLSYEYHVGPIPDGLTIDHLCRNTKCVHPEHLEAVTDAENRRRAYAAKTHCKHGHELASDNVIVKKRGEGRAPVRNCRTCNNNQQRARAAGAA